MYSPRLTSDFELILVDDGSEEQVPRSVVEDARIKYVRQEKSGVSAARNLGISLASGEYVAFLDSDDLFVPVKLEKQMALMDARPNLLLSHTSYQRITIEGDNLNVISSGAFSGRLRRLESAYQIATPTVMIRREALGGSRMFEESLTVGDGEDIILWARFALTSKVLGINEPLSKVRMHGNNVALDEEKQYLAVFNLINYAIEQNPEFASVPQRIQRPPREDRIGRALRLGKRAIHRIAGQSIRRIRLSQKSWFRGKTKVADRRGASNRRIIPSSNRDE